MPCGTVGNAARKSGFPPSMVTDPAVRSQRDIDSTPPATTRSWYPLATPMAATVIACCADPQKRFSVRPGTVSGHPASSVANRPTASWSPVRMPLPAITSSTSSGSNPIARRQRPEALGEQLLGMDVVQRAVGTPLPRGVRTTSRIHASPIVNSPR